MTQPKTTMADVARVARVSPTTAARVIHNRGYVSAENRKRVLDAVESTGYRPNLQARSLRLQRSYTLGLVLSSARENPFYTHISHAIRTAASAEGYSMLTVNHSYSAETEISGIKQFLDHGVEAVVLCHALNTKHLAPLIRANVPLIQVERQDVEQAYFIAIDPQPGMSAAVQSLVNQGHNRIAFIGAKPAKTTNTSSVVTAEQRRSEAFREAVFSCGLAEANCPTILGEYFPSAPDDALPGRLLAEELLARDDATVTAIIAGSDILAAGILQALYEKGIKVPGDMSVIGYDDSVAEFLSPPLSSIAQPYSAIGDAVVAFVGRIVENGGKDNLRELRVSTSLVQRRSTGAFPSNRPAR